ncbi:asialoglycoprotein receptor 1-like isoform 2-T2 [Acanthopagrus schlegelii]
MDTTQSQSEPEDEMSSQQEVSRDFNAHGHSGSHHKTSGQEKGRSAFSRHRVVILSLGLLNAVLLLTAAVIGIYCAKAQNNFLQGPNSAANSLVVEVNYLRNQSGINKATLEAQSALAKERTNHFQLKMQVKQQKALTDSFQGRIETLQTQRANLQSNKTTLEENCGRCRPGWIVLKSSCYYFSSRQVANSKKNWLDSRADCIQQGGDLLVINTLEEQQFMSDNVPRLSSPVWWQSGYWIGLTDVAMPGAWVWVNNVTEVDTAYWRFGQPNHNGPQSGNCAAFYYHSDNVKTWYNGNCQDHQLSWICEMESSQDKKLPKM